MAAARGPGKRARNGASPASGRIRRRITTLASLYAHALAIEHEAVGRYGEFAVRMSDLGNETIARLFRELQDFEQRHVAALTAKARDMDLPAIAPGQHAWLDSGAPVPEARAFVFRAMTPRMALDIALVAEVRARAFFESVHAATGDRGIRALAREFAEEEQTHIQTVRYAIDRLPEPYRDSEERPGHPATPLEL